MEPYSPCQFYVDCWFSQGTLFIYFGMHAVHCKGSKARACVRPPIERKISADPEEPRKRVTSWRVDITEQGCPIKLDQDRVLLPVIWGIL